MSDATNGPPRSSPHVDMEAAARAIDQFLRALGQDEQSNSQLVGTGKRVAEAFASEFCAGEGVDLDARLRAHLLPVATQGAIVSRNVVRLHDLPLHVMCPHHLLPAEGSADVIFEPALHLVGIGAIAELVEVASRRLILQETLGDEIVAALTRTLAPRWVAVRLELAHSCMRARGERAHGARVETWTSSGSVPDSIFGGRR